MTDFWNQTLPGAVGEADRMAHVRFCSPFAASLLDRYPEWAQDINAHQAPRRAELDTLIADAGLDAGLRRFRNRQMLRIIWRDLSGLALLEETFSDLTQLAEQCLSAAIDQHSQALSLKHGSPLNSDGNVQDLVVLGLGKFGGGELNLSSDIDIIFCYRSSGECNANTVRRLSSEQYFIRLVRAVIGSLSDVTEDGFCFRVDTRLRPFGDSGPLVSSLPALDQYYQREGRDWERYALIKARPVAGDPQLGRDLLEQIRPFVYRRYIDYTAVEALQEMHASVTEDARRHDRAQDIKRGPGGIREIEFLAQCFQLLRGGREPALRTPSLGLALAGIEELGLMAANSVQAIRENYVYLRRMENRIQAMRDQQTHTLPQGEDLSRLLRAAATGAGITQPGAVPAQSLQNEDQMLAELAAVRERVGQRFQSIFPSQPAPESNPIWVEAWRGAQLGRQDSKTPDSNPADEDQPLPVFLRGLDRMPLSQRARRRLDQFMPVLLQRLDRLSLSTATLHRIFDLVLAICQRSPYLVLLVQNTPALERMIDLFARSEWIAGSVIRFPALLDELIDPSLGQQIPTKSELLQSVERILGAGQDTESVLSALNYLKLATALRIAVAQLDQSITASEAQAGLAGLAAAILQGVLDLALIEVEARHGHMEADASAEQKSQHGMAVIAYGSLAAGEPGYESDLDIVFLFDHPDQVSSGTAAGKGCLPAERYYARLAQRLLSFLTVMTPSGRLYPVDTRLRPNGRAGALVSSLDAFAEYQLKQAWTWEMQALTRARFVAGSQATGARFANIRRQALSRPRQESELIGELSEMRVKMMQEHSGMSSLAAPKHQAGGLVDIEFIAQLGVLTNAANFPFVLVPTDTAGQLQALAEMGWLPQDEALLLCNTLRELHQGRMLQTLLPGEQRAATDTIVSSQVFKRVFGL